MSKNRKLANSDACVFSSEAKSKHTLKDSVFKDLFSDLENVKKLYLSLHPEDANVSTTEILECTHKSIFVESLLNDLSFIVRDKLMVMVEVQSTWSRNVVFRLLSYSIQALTDYVKKTKQDKYGSSLLKLPKVELYVLYTGKITEHRFDELSLANLYYNNDSNFLEAKVKVLYGDKGNDIIFQYAEFVRILHECCQRLGYSRSAVQKAIAICKDRNILKDYLVEREVEVVDIITSLFDQDYVMGVHIEAEKRKVAVAMEEAAKNKQFESVKRMLEDKLPIELIQRYTQLAPERIKEIASQLGVEF